MNVEANTLERRLEALAVEKLGARYVWFDYLNEKQLLTAGLITEEQFRIFGEMVEKRLASLTNEPARHSVIPPENISVFLSYNNKDREMAQMIKVELAKHNVIVRMDDEISIGESIKEFIIRQIRENTAVLWLVSENSLKSPWVNYEISMAGYSELLTDKHFIPISETRFFMEDKFYDDTFDELERLISVDDAEIRRLKDERKYPEIIENRRAKRVHLRDQLGPVLMKLQQENRVFPVGPAEFNNTLERIARLLMDLQSAKKTKI